MTDIIGGRTSVTLNPNSPSHPKNTSSFKTSFHGRSHSLAVQPPSNLVLDGYKTGKKVLGSLKFGFNDKLPDILKKQ